MKGKIIDGFRSLMNMKIFDLVPLEMMEFDKKEPIVDFIVPSISNTGLSKIESCFLKEHDCIVDILDGREILAKYDLDEFVVIRSKKTNKSYVFLYNITQDNDGFTFKKIGACDFTKIDRWINLVEPSLIILTGLDFNSRMERLRQKYEIKIIETKYNHLFASSRIASCISPLK